MLKVRVIPTILVQGVGIVKGVGFDSWRRIGVLLPAVRVYVARDVDELMILDVAASPEGRPPDVDLVRDAAVECSVPLTVGGGIRKIEEVRALLRAGADKVCINTAAYDDPAIVQQTAAMFGSQCVVAGIDVRDGLCVAMCNRRPTTRDPVAWAKELEALGAGEILLTSVERDGTMKGYDVDLIARVARAVSIPVIASGGAGSFEHMHDAIVHGASAVAAASIFQFTEATPREAKAYLASRGVPVRMGL